MKFDIIIANPPWGQSIHYEFTQKYLDLAHDVISIMPISIIKRDSKHFKKFKYAYNDRLYDVEEIDSSVFQNTNMQNCCIYCFKDKTDKLHIKYIDGKEENINCINEKDYSGFTDYEKEIVKYLYNEKPNWVCGQNGGMANGRDDRNPKKHLSTYVNKILRKLPDDKVYLTCLCAYSAGRAIFFSSRTGQICNTKRELEKLLYERGGAAAHYMWFNNIQSAENCKAAMQRPLIRFPLLRTQSNQSLSKIHFQYIPDIKWENIESDYDILKACGCPDDKCKEYVEYCNKIIQEVDKKRHNKILKYQ